MAGPNEETLESVTSLGSTRRPWRRLARLTGIGVAALIVATYVAVGWYVSGQIIDDGLRVSLHEVEYDTDVLAASGDDIRIRVPDESSTEADADAVMGLRWTTGYGQIGPATSIDGDLQTRPFELLQGDQPAIGENVVDFDNFAFPNDPSVLGVDYGHVTYSTPLGDVEGWLFSGTGATWIVAVHGNAADRTEFLRLAQSLADLDYPILATRYRNDQDSPRTKGSLVLMGQEEYVDVASAVDYALANGASDVVVYGSSMGGALTLSYALEESRDVIRGLILEAPVADLREIVQLRSGDALPVGGPIGDSFLAVGRLFVTLRTGLEFDVVDYIERAPDLDTPILLFHGSDDPRVPIEISENLAAARPDLVEFHPIEDAAHVRAWNEGPTFYAETITEFLSRIGSAR